MSAMRVCFNLTRFVDGNRISLKGQTFSQVSQYADVVSWVLSQTPRSRGMRELKNYLTATHDSRSQDENDDRSEDDPRADDSSEDYRSEDRFVVPDNFVDYESNASVSEEEEEEEEESEGEEEESEEGEEEEGEEEKAAEDGHDFETAKSIIRNDPYLELGETSDGRKYCYRVADSVPGHKTGIYDILLRKMEKITGRKRKRGDDFDTEKSWMPGLDIDRAYHFERDNFAGCLCNQNPFKLGGLNRRYGLKDRKSNIIFLCGGCCTKRLLRLPGQDMSVYFEVWDEEDTHLYRLTSLL